MQITRPRKPHLPLPTTILIVVGVSVWVSMASDAIAWYPATYTESAHGDHISGVNRSTVVTDPDHPDAYDVGECAHCHDTFSDSICGNDPNGLMLFAPRNPTSQTDNFCFQCHRGESTVQQVTNYDYGATFGGGTAMSDDIQDAFNFGLPNQDWTTGSSHNLQLVRNWLKTKAPGDWITVETNACLACHSPHLSQKNSAVEATDQGGVKTAIRRPQAPSSGTNQPGNLWGDEWGSYEMLAEDSIVYQAPYYGSGPWDENGPFEPAGDNTEDGSNLPNYVRFCAYGSCHSIPIPDAATDADPNSVVDRDLLAIDWTSSGDAHGALAGSPKQGYEGGEPCTFGSLKPPYDKPFENYVLACTDCHEPHGSEGAFLLRTVVNGKQVSPIKQWAGTTECEAIWEFCTACHTVTAQCGTHQFPDPPIEVGCNFCHRHGVNF